MHAYFLNDTIDMKIDLRNFPSLVTSFTIYSVASKFSLRNLDFNCIKKIVNVQFAL